MEELMSGEKEISQEEYNCCSSWTKLFWKAIWQTKVHGVWVDGYMFNNHQTLRKVYRTRFHRPQQ